MPVPEHRQLCVCVCVCVCQHSHPTPPPDDALELLSKTFTNEAVRSYAVAVLEKAPDEELMDYLLQLVQTLRYEKDPDSVHAPWGDRFHPNRLPLIH